MQPIQLSYFIVNNYSSLSPGGITPLKLQKLLYYVYVWGIVSKNKIIDTTFVKWSFGPVNEEVYFHFKYLGKNPISPNQTYKIKVGAKEKKFIDFIIYNYIKFDATTLSAMSHKDLPWQETPQNYTISDITILKFYSKLNFAKNFPIGKSKNYYPVETDLHYAFLLDMPSKISKSNIYFDSFDEFMKLEKANQKSFEEEIKEWLYK